MELDIVELIEKNPITRFNDNFRSKLIDKLRLNFNNNEQQLFLSSFYCYLNYDEENDFVIDLNNIWKWLGFSRKEECKRVLTRHFKIDIDYKIMINGKIVPPIGGSVRHGYKETILLNIKTFKKLCLKSSTKKADEIHDYFIKLEKILQDVLIEESKELQNQLQIKENLFIKQMEQTELEKEEILEKTLLSQFPINTQCVYYGKIDNKDTVGGNLIKFGNSNNLQERVKAHKKIYNNFRLINAFKVSNKIEIENCIKKHDILKKRIRSIMIDNINYRELICIDPVKDDDFSFEKLDEYINEIIKENQYNIENYNKILEKNNKLEYELKVLMDEKSNLENIIDKLQKKLDSYKPSIYEIKFKANNKVETSGGYSLFAFGCDNLRYKIGLCKTISLNMRENAYKVEYPDGEIKLQVKIKHPFIEKVLLYLIKRHLVFLNNDTYDGSINEINKIFNIALKLEDLLINNDLENITKIINGDKEDIEIYNDPEIPFVRKSKRSVDQIDKITGKILATYPSIETAGKSVGLTTGTAVGIALRNKSICQGYLWRYSGISKEDQMTDQPVVRINCKTGEHKNYPNIASAARDAKISAPGLRNRILTDVHINGFHWIFDKSTTHYTN